MLYATLCFAAVATTAAFQTPVAPLHLAKPAVSRVADGEPPARRPPPRRAASAQPQIPAHAPMPFFPMHALPRLRAVAHLG